MTRYLWALVVGVVAMIGCVKMDNVQKVQRLAIDRQISMTVYMRGADYGRCAITLIDQQSQIIETTNGPTCEDAAKSMLERMAKP